jgi:hypothetical protein
MEQIDDANSDFRPTMGFQSLQALDLFRAQPCPPAPGKFSPLHHAIINESKSELEFFNDIEL